jgi:pyruvate,water dikinase
MAVLLQEMVSPMLSGVVFSVNPLTGMDEIIVEAVRGSGEALVQGGVQPHRWVNKWGAWVEVPRGERAQEGIDLSLIEQVVDQTRAIAKAYGRPVDLEWMWDGKTLYWLQLREITALDIDIYSNKIAREVFPGLIKPLVWSVNVPLVNGAWVKLFTELIGPNDIEPDDLAKSFYSRAYFNMGAVGRIFEILGFPRESLELLMGFEVEGQYRPSFRPTARTFRLLPRMLVSASRMLGFARRIEAFLPAARTQYQRLASQPLAVWDAVQLVRHVERLYRLTQETAYYNIVTPLLMQAYHALLKTQLGRVGVDLETLDLMQGEQELERYDPSFHLSTLHRQYAALDAALRARIDERGYSALDQIPGLEPFRSALDEFLEQFGHLSDSGNDFSAVPWRETPDLVLNMVIQYAEPTRHTARMDFPELPLAPIRKGLMHPLYKRARQFRLHREAVSSLYTCGYGLFRDAFLALGARFVQRDVIPLPEDIFYLNMDEVRSIAADLHTTSSPGAIAEQRKQELERCRHLVPPGIIYGDEAPPVQAVVSGTLQGTPTSRGRYSGPVRVVQGLVDFNKVQQGDVLVIPYADVGWTPLFARAGAVIAESGGMLSHSSIVAREYRIPAVVSVAYACHLVDDTIVSVDGYRGEVTVHESTQPIEVMHQHTLSDPD